MDADYQKREVKAVDAIKKAIPSSLKQDMLSMSKGMFAELYESKVFPQHYMAVGIDGVGTKLILAEAMHKFDTVGIDLVAMSANDLATLGAVSPFLFIDYFAVQDKIQEEGIAGEIMKGIVNGLKQCDCSDILRNSIKINLGKGETASVDELISAARPGYGFDIAGAMIGFIEKNKIHTKIEPGDKIIALKSSGPHSNGYTDLRLKLLNGDFETRPAFKKRYQGKFSLADKFEGKTIGEHLLEPTKIYSKIIAKIADKFPIIGVNNTGYGLKNLNRHQGKFEFVINDPIKPQPIFDLVQKEAGYSDKEMYQKFNMGQGFFMVCKEEDADDIVKISKGQLVGEVRKKDKTRTILIKDDKEIVFEGY